MLTYHFRWKENIWPFVFPHAVGAVVHRGYNLDDILLPHSLPPFHILHSLLDPISHCLTQSVPGGQSQPLYWLGSLPEFHFLPLLLWLCEHKCKCIVEFEVSLHLLYRSTYQAITVYPYLLPCPLITNPSVPLSLFSVPLPAHSSCNDLTPSLIPVQAGQTDEASYAFLLCHCLLCRGLYDQVIFIILIFNCPFWVSLCPW